MKQKFRVIVVFAIVSFVAIILLLLSHKQDVSPTLAMDKLNKLAETMRTYKTENGGWPTALIELKDPSLTSFQGRCFQYDPTNLVISLEMNINNDDLIFKITNGRYGVHRELASISINLEEANR
jgi:hypothetical protein